MGENGERDIESGFPRERDRVHAVHFADLGTKNSLQILWEMKIRQLENTSHNPKLILIHHETPHLTTVARLRTYNSQELQSPPL